MTNPTIPDIPSVRDQVSPEDWLVRVDLAAAHRLVPMFGWDDLVFTHVSARVPGEELNGNMAQSLEVSKGLGSRLTWPGLLRRLDRRNPGYAI